MVVLIPVIIGITIGAVFSSLRLARRSARDEIPFGQLGIKSPETTVCEHTWVAAQRAAAPVYLFQAATQVVVAVTGVGLALAGLNLGLAFGVWLALLLVAVFVCVGIAGGRGSTAAKAVDCEHTRRGARSSRLGQSRRTGGAGTRPGGPGARGKRRR